MQWNRRVQVLFSTFNLYIFTKYRISAMAVRLQEKTYSRYKEGMVLKWANMVYTQITRNTQEPIITMTVGTTPFPNALEAAIVLSINAETQ